MEALLSIALSPIGPSGFVVPHSEPKCNSILVFHSCFNFLVCQIHM